jgi:hypothetical protein
MAAIVMRLFTERTASRTGELPMKNVGIRAVVGLFAVASTLAVASPASAQKRWANAKNRNEVLAVAGGPQCSPAGHCWLTGGQQVVVWNSSTADTLWSAALPSNTAPVTSELPDARGDQMCLGVSAASTAPGAHLVVWPCDGSDNQYWTVTPASDFGLNAVGCYLFLNNDGQAMAVAGGIVANGSHVVQRPWTTAVTLDMAWCPE